MSELTVYEKPTCSSCRALAELLQKRGIAFDQVDYQVEPLPEDRIRELLGKAGVGPREALRTHEDVYSELGLDDADDDELIRQMAVHPQLLQRPIVELGNRAVIARPADRVLGLLDA
jgi:arsenate reductase